MSRNIFILNSTPGRIRTDNNWILNPTTLPDWPTGAKIWSGKRELNPQNLIGNQVFYQLNYSRIPDIGIEPMYSVCRTKILPLN